MVRKEDRTDEWDRNHTKAVEGNEAKIKRLEEKIAQMRETLEQIITLGKSIGDSDDGIVAIAAITIARAALKENADG